MKKLKQLVGVTTLLAIATLFLSDLFRVTVSADNTAQTIPFSQNWTNIGLITANDDWSGVRE